MKIATWNVNGVRAREAQLVEWIGREQPDVVCLQELKATREQIPASLSGLAGYWSYWHGERAYSGVGLLVRKACSPAEPVFTHPEFDHETRIVSAIVAGVSVSSIYVPNGGKDFNAKIRFLEALIAHARRCAAEGQPIVFCGDLNVAHREIDVHPKERKDTVIGQLPEERALVRPPAGRGARGRRAHPRSGERSAVHVVAALARHAPAQHRLADRLRAGEHGRGGQGCGVRRLPRSRHERPRPRRR